MASTRGGPTRIDQILRRYKRDHGASDSLLRQLSRAHASITQNERKVWMRHLAVELTRGIEAQKAMKRSTAAQRKAYSSLEAATLKAYPRFRSTSGTMRYHPRWRAEGLPQWLSRLPSGWPTLIFIAPYTAGYPLEEQTIAAPQDAAPNAVVSKTAWAMPGDGKLSLGAGGGRIWVEGQPIYPPWPMPDRWIFGDAIDVSAGIFQLANIGRFTGSAKTLSVGARVSTWKPLDPWDWPSCVYCWPGLNSSFGQGTVAVVASIWMTVAASLTTATVTKSANLLYSVIHSIDDSNNAIVDEDHFYPSGVEVNASLAVPAGTQLASVSVEASVICLRTGVDDPGGGFTGIDFRDDQAQPIFKPDLPIMQNTPLSVDEIAVHLV